MKALTLYQPWAQLIVLGPKTIETRSWSTKYRGDEYIASALKMGRYRVDPDTGNVFGPKGRQLACPPDDEGYLIATIFMGQGDQMNVRVHRLVAASAWGIDAIRGRQVGHRNGNPADNRLENLWLPNSIKEHNDVDGTTANLIKGQQHVKPSWAPCVDCGDPDGVIRKGSTTPNRVSGARFGIDGELCWRCYRKHDERKRRQDRKGSL